MGRTGEPILPVLAKTEPQPLTTPERREPLGRPDQGRRGGHDRLDVLVGEGRLLGDTLRVTGSGATTPSAAISRRPRATVFDLRAAVRLIARPAPCWHVSNASALPSPSPTYDAVPIDPGIRTVSPARARTAPLRWTIPFSPKWCSQAA